MNKGNLYNYIISDQNIYHAIYSMESYIFEKTLLDENDIICIIGLRINLI